MIGVISNLLGVRQNSGQSRPNSDNESGARSDPTQSNRHDRKDGEDSEGEVVASLIDALETGAVSEEQLGKLRRHLRTGRSESRDVKLNHLQTKLDDMEGYIDALEEFIDEEGTGSDILDDLEAENRELRQELDRVDSKVESIQQEQTETEEVIETVTTDVEDLRKYVQDVEGRHTREIIGVDAKIDRAEIAFDSALDEVEDQIVELQGDFDDLSSIRTDLTDLEDEIDELHGTFDTVESRLDELTALRDETDQLQETISDLSNQKADSLEVENLNERITELEAIESELASVRDELAEMKSFRDTLIDTVTEQPQAAIDG